MGIVDKKRFRLDQVRAGHVPPPKLPTSMQVPSDYASGVAWPYDDEPAHARGGYPPSDDGGGDGSGGGLGCLLVLLLVGFALIAAGLVAVSFAWLSIAIDA